MITIAHHHVKSIELTPIKQLSLAATRSLVIRYDDGSHESVQTLFGDDTANLVVANTEALAAAYQHGRDDERNGVTRPAMTTPRSNS